MNRLPNMNEIRINKIRVNRACVNKAWLAAALILTSALFADAQTSAARRQQQAPVANEYQTGAVLWTQTAGEWRALCYQAYRIARMSLDADLAAARRQRTAAGGRDRRPRAIVVDVDETVLDNSPYQASLILNRKTYDAATWKAWTERAEALAIPGALEFLRYANRRGVRVFYVTNRRLGEREATARNLRQLGFPDVSDESLLVRGDESSKEPRRRSVAERYRIVLLVGDNLNDFTDVFEGKNVAARLSAVENHKSEFGTRFIVLPNVMYGDWESAIYDHNSRLSETEREAKRRAALRGY